MFMEVTNIKFNGNLPSGSHADTCGQTGMMKLIGAFHACVTGTLKYYSKG
jgi:hypothetical protein